MNIPRVLAVKVLNFKSDGSFLSTLLVRSPRALLCEWPLELGGVGIYVWLIEFGIIRIRIIVYRTIPYYTEFNSI